MNDPGLDDAIADEANALDRNSPQVQPEDSNSTSYTDKTPGQLDTSGPLPAQWWLASTVYPLAAVCTFHIAVSVYGVLTKTGNIWANGQCIQRMLSSTNMANGPR